MIIPPSASPSWVKSELVKKQDKLTQGDGISISNNVVSVDLAEATQTSSGLMSAEDKKNLDTLKAGTISEYVKDAESTGVLLNLTKADGSVVSVRVTNVGQNTIDTDAAYPILLSGMKATNTATGTVAATNLTKAVTVNPMTGELTAPIFKGSLDGTASKATADGDGQNIASTYAKKSEIPDTSGLATKAELEPFAKTADLDKYALDTDLSAYLPLNGGTMAGHLDMNSGVNIRFGTTNYFQGLTASGNRFDIFGLINSTRLVVGGTYPTLELIGKSGTRVTYNGENLALESDIPDVSGFATKAEIPDISGLATKAEVSLLPTFEPQVVQSLPTSNISSKVLYLVPADNGENDRYDQYIYINNAWERIGSGMMTVDSSLSDSSTNPVQNKVIQSALAGKLSTTGTAARATADASGNDILSTYAKKGDLAGYLPLTGGTTSAEITVGGLGIITGGSEKTSYSGVQAVRRCTYDDDHVNTAGFIVNGDGSAKFMHRRGDVTAEEDAFLRFDALGFRMVASGAKGVYAPYESISVFEALIDQNHPKFKDTDIALVSDLPTAGSNIIISGGKISATDQKVGQVTVDGSDNEFPILLKTSPNSSTEIAAVGFASGVTINPKTGHISAVAFDGPATKALADADGNSITSTYAKKAEIPDISGLATKSELSSYATVSALAGKLDTTGTAAKATADASGNVFTSTYATKSSLNAYMPLTGGTLSGNVTIQMQSYPNITMKNQNWGGQFAITEADDGTALFQNNKAVNGADTYVAFYLKPTSAGLGNVLSIGMDDGSGWKGATVLHSQNFADHITPAGIGAPKLRSPNDLVHNNNEFTFIPAGHSGELYINYRTASGSCDGNISNYHFCGGNGKEVTIMANYFKGKFQGSGARPEYNGADVAMLSDIPDVSNFATKEDVATGGGNYLPLTGGTLSGELTILETDQLLGGIGILRLGSQASVTGALGGLVLSANDTASIGLDNNALQPVTMDSSIQIGLGTASSQWKEIHGTAIYQNGLSVPSVIASTTDIGEGAALTSGTLYLVYE